MDGWRAGTARDGREEEKLEILLSLVKDSMYKLEDPSSSPRDGGRKGLENPRALTSVQLPQCGCLRGAMGQSRI